MLKALAFEGFESFDFEGVDSLESLVFESFEDVVLGSAGGVGEVLWTDEDVDGSTLPQGFIHQALPEVDLFMDVGQHINYDKELKKLEEKLKKVGRDQEKVEKQMRGKFQFRLSSEEAATRREELEKVAALLKDQKNMVERLKMEAEMLKSSD